MNEFYVHGAVHRNSVSINIQQDASIHSLSANCSTCFVWFLHPSSGAQITVFTASGTSQPLLLPVAITIHSTPHDGWRIHPKHIELFTDKINCV